MFSIKRVLAIFFALFLIIASQTKVFAADLNLPETVINPDKYLFFSIKRLIEKGTIFTKFSKVSKAEYYRELTLRRMAELKYVVENNLVGEIQHSTERLSYQIGIISDYINTNKTELVKEKKPISDLLLSYKDLLSNLRDKYPANSSFWMLVQHSINSIDLNLEKLR